MSLLVQIAQHGDGRRWWILRRGDRAVSLTAIPATDDQMRRMPPSVTGIRDAAGRWLIADHITVHAPGDDSDVSDCPALVGVCDGEGGAMLGAPELLAAWAATGHDDAVIAAGLAAVATREWGAP
jgi:hypothetical protein